MVDIDDTVKKWIKFFTMPQNKRDEMGKAAREGVLKHYTYERTAKIWEEIFDKIPTDNRWLSQPRIHQPVLQIPNNLSNADFVRWCVINIWGMPNRVNHPLVVEYIKNLNCGFWLEGHMRMSNQPFTRDTVVQIMLDYNRKLNEVETMRHMKNIGGQQIVVSDLPEFNIA